MALQGKLIKTPGESLEDLEEPHKTLVNFNVSRQLPKINITRTCRVQNDYLRAMYKLKKEEYQVRYGSVTEVEMLHATSKSNVMSIITDNLDWRRVTRSKYGRGVSFSQDADYANFHSNATNGAQRAFIVANVLIKKQCFGHSTMVVPEAGSDYATSLNGFVFVKFNDNEFLPKYVVFYDAPDRSTTSSAVLQALQFDRKLSRLQKCTFEV